MSEDVVRQCLTCPWREGADVSLIPNYRKDLHEQLAGTIAKPAELNIYGPLRVMACHYSRPRAEFPCAGWLHHQLGDGNNIAVRLAVRRGRLPAPEVYGPQKATFEETLCSSSSQETS